MLKEITVYSRTVCPKCMLVKKQLKIATIDFQEINMDIDAEAKEKIKALGFSSAPIIKNGDNYMSFEQFMPLLTTIVES